MRASVSINHSMKTRPRWQTRANKSNWRPPHSRRCVMDDEFWDKSRKIYRQCPINFSAATTCRYVLNVDISGTRVTGWESLRVKQSGAFGLIYDTNFMEKSSTRPSIRSRKEKRGGEKEEGGKGRKICSNVALVIEIGAGREKLSVLSPANETANDEQTSFRKYLFRHLDKRKRFFRTEGA